MIENLKRLLESATEGPWGLETVATSVGSCHKIGPFPSNGVHGETHACVYADNVRVGEAGNTIGNELRANAALIVALRNMAPALIKVVEAAKEADAKLPPHSLIFDAEYYCFAEKLRDALAALNRDNGVATATVTT